MSASTSKAARLLRAVRRGVRPWPRGGRVAAGYGLLAVGLVMLVLPGPGLLLLLVGLVLLAGDVRWAAAALSWRKGLRRARAGR